MLEVVIVDAHTLETFEQLGSKDKFWYDERKYLFKARRPGTGEDWAEVVSAILANRLGLPRAEYDLAEAINLPEPSDEQPEESEPRGVRSLNFVPDGGRLVLGNELIGRVAASETAGRYAQRRQFHTPSRVAHLLSSSEIQSPIGWPRPIEKMTAQGLMAGYLMFDVLIGNQDRHEENWGLVLHRGKIYLAPTFDHASSLGRENQDKRRAMKLAHKDPAHGVPGYAAKALSQLHERKGGERLTTVCAFAEYSAYCEELSQFWLDQLKRIDEDYFRGVLAVIPDTHITDVGREFAVQVLIENKRRLQALML